MYKNILIPVDFDHEEGIENSFRAARLLADENAKFTVMHVMEAIPGYVRGQISEDILKHRHEEMKLSLDKAASGLPGATALLETGHAAQNIVNFAERNDVDCIVLSSHTPRLQKFFIGSTAAKVVNHASCTVLVIR